MIARWGADRAGHRPKRLIPRPPHTVEGEVGSVDSAQQKGRREKKAGVRP